MDLNNNPNNDILHVSFNQDASCFAVGTQTGFLVCDSNPCNLRFSRQFDEGIGIVEMLFTTNILALVGGGARPKYQPNCVAIWDNHQDRKIADLEFPTNVKSVRMRRDRIIVALDSAIFIYNFDDLRLIGRHDTNDLKLGLLSVSPTSAAMVLAFPSPSIVGEVCWQSAVGGVLNTKLITSSTLEIVSVNASGTLLAVTSGKGTLIRVIDLSSSDHRVTTYRRGTTSATIQSLAFSADSTLLSCTSNRGTIHIFNLEAAASDSASSSSSYFSILIGMVEIRAVASYSVPEFHSICAFIPPSNSNAVGCKDTNVLVVVGSSGRYYALQIEKKSDNSFTIIDINNGETIPFLP